jgi:tartrate dehydratase beta subunit/fumarate hydratase class I family protein
MEQTIIQRATKKLSFLFTEEKIRVLKVGDEVLISGIGFTGRDTAGLASVSQQR